MWHEGCRSAFFPLRAQLRLGARFSRLRLAGLRGFGFVPVVRKQAPAFAVAKHPRDRTLQDLGDFTRL
jgi:hypothetical protein